MRLSRIFAGLAAVLCLGGCFFETESALRKDLSETLYLRDALYFRDRLGCTAALYSLYSRYPKAGVLRVGDMYGALYMLEQGKPVAFTMKLSPNDISMQVRDHERRSGLGIVTAGAAGVAMCLDEDMQALLYDAMFSPDTLTIFDPNTKLLTLVDWPNKRAWALRAMD
ncbi:hypothetical protein AL036_13655 [Salipiger aestuarii]|uniref:Uncharacterized protein n=1 Tax=Salipiger aestuarii TaxID=568098 RepID=A0A327Y2H0_9RHOB|nr:hypothetical protein [Salipiger aestuarii]EIE48688.1 hypothetical protein C357_22645 [Citreicella sp. 357]KAA8606671.1 hypothetical protein AL036_13655 [Salipiger aestuarii]KAA8610546.1 hypothetical protein AL037_13190 [Salipiger aestuarii]KAB2541295.1 hypothetical protein AL035_12980 [Salipiger aestuarii]RAK13935.1 hypothetical protein ATI53_103229 [Salipiger aestuarii]